MKKKILSRVSLALVILSLIVPSICLAQGSDEASQLRTLLHKGEVQVEKWEKTASTIIALTVLVGVLGIVAGALQKSSSNWCKIATVIVGLCISALTLVLNTAFSADHRQLRRLAVEGREIITDLDLMISSGIPKDEESHRAWLDVFQKRLHQLLELGKESYPTSARLEVLPTIYAQSAGKKPDWISKPPNDPADLYFLGIGDDPSLQKAREISRDNAVHRAFEYLSTQFQTAQQTKQASLDLSVLSQYVVRSAEEAGIYFEYSPAGRSYRYYTLLRIHKDIAEADLKLFGLQKKTAVPGGLNKVVQTAPDLAKAYSGTSFPYLMGEYRIAQRHAKVLDLAKGKTGVYVGDVHHTGPAQVLLFKADRLPGISEKQKANYSQLKQSLKPDEILLDKIVSNQERVRIGLAGQQLLFEFKYSSSAVGEDYAIIAIKSSVR